MKKLNFGCGADLKDGWDNVDIQKGKGIKINFNFDKFPYPLRENYYDYVLMSQVIEHLMYPEKALYELHKACRDGAIIRIETPHYTNKGAYNSLQHRGFFSEKAFTNFIMASTLVERNKCFKIKTLQVTPTIMGKFIPSFIRNKLSLFLNGLQSQIHIEYEIVK
ncbi:methyltransferase domain-containing protein [Candidatus Pacearchaeota archaeon]|nr:methyltransferase domain-containing protein [Candidatus Pacearchaeota archaeon]